MVPLKKINKNNKKNKTDCIIPCDYIPRPVISSSQAIGRGRVENLSQVSVIGLMLLHRVPGCYDLNSLMAQIN